MHFQQISFRTSETVIDKAEVAIDITNKKLHSSISNDVKKDLG